MKQTCFRCIATTLCLALIIASLVMPTSAADITPLAPITEEKIISQTVETLPDGITMIYTVSQITGTSAISTNATKQVTGKTQVDVKKNSTTLLTFTVHGTFNVTVGSSATCIGSSYTYSIKESGIEFVSASATKSGNKAIASGEFVKKVLFITTATYTPRATLSCDANGNLTGGT